MVLGEHEAAQLRPEVTIDAVRQRSRNPDPVMVATEGALWGGQTRPWGVPGANPVQAGRADRLNGSLALRNF
jgi:hypothetical protein